jgi:poly [ADP-ribose] polymerase
VPSRIELSPSARAKCRTCKQPIAKDDLRFAEAVSSAYDDDESLIYYHLACAASKRPAQFGPVLAKYKKSVPDRAALETTMQTSGTTNRLESIQFADRAPTGRATCQHCRELIPKDSLRIAFKLDADPFTPGTGFIHAACGRAFAGAGIVERLKTRSKKLGKPQLAELAKILAS